MTEGQTVIVTGGAGFIGSFLCEHYVRKGKNVVVVDDFSRGRRENLSRINPAGIKVVDLDLASENANKVMTQVLRESQASLVFHYAAVNGTQHFYDHPGRTQLVNSLGTLAVVEALNEVAGELAIRPLLVLASTSEIYGPSPVTPTREDEAAILHLNSPRDSYAAAKMMSEFYVRYGLRSDSANFMILRIFNVYGPYMVSSKYGQVVPEFISRLKSGETPLRLIGDGSQTRSFCFVEDHVNIVERLTTNPDAYGRAINVGDDHEISISELANILQELMGIDVGVIAGEPRQNDTVVRRPCLQLMNLLAGRVPRTSLREGLLRTIPFY